MSITSGSFLLFALALTVLYFLVPKHGQWMLLLLASAGFYCAAGLQYGAYILFTALSTYCGARWIGRLAAQQQAYLKANKEQLSREEKKAYKAGNKARRKAVMIAALLLNFGLLAVFKYGDFVLTQLNRAAALLGSGPVHGPLGLIAPLGISFYTFQSMGYLVDVYWEKCAPEKNIARMLLFVSFFPQIIQGPISNFSQLAPQLYAPHSFSAARLGSGLQRMLWGFFKKLVIADTLAPYVQAVFANYTEYSGVAVLVGAFLYSAQIYADFSGYMDIVCGLCEIWGIQLAENFQRPYFSKSIAEYWRRWHITLGEWFKTYLYYPVAVSHFARNAGKRWQKRFGGSVGKTIPATVALLIVWLTTGLWHGASWAYIAWGGVNGAFIIFSLWMEPVYLRWKQALHIQEDRWLWRAFQTLRTFCLVTVIKVLPEVGGLRRGLGLWKQVVTNWHLPETWQALFPYADTWINLAVIGGGLVLMLAASLLQRKQPVRAFLMEKPMVLRYTIYFVLLGAILLFGCYGEGFDPQDFMYFKF